jgi:hypothetical protein
MDTAPLSGGYQLVTTGVWWIANMGLRSSSATVSPAAWSTRVWNRNDRPRDIIVSAVCANA